MIGHSVDGGGVSSVSMECSLRGGGKNGGKGEKRIERD